MDRRRLVGRAASVLAAPLVPALAAQPIVPAAEARPETPGTEAALQADRRPSDRRPNFVLIVTDDQDADSLESMSKVRRLLGQEGTDFSNFVVSTPGCSPSRASILRGQHTHNHGIWTGKGPEGGYSAFARTGLERSTVATWLQDRGYRTALVGKYLNEYGVKPETAKVPPGWDEWCAAPEIKYFDYDLIENDRVVHRGNKPEDYLTDVLSRKAIAFLETAARSDKPFFLYLAPRAPHGPATPAPRYARAFGNAKVPRTDAFNEADVADKPSYVVQSPRLRRKQIRTLDALHRDQLRTLQSVDKMVEDVLTTLRRTGTLDKTYVFFTSDNGFLLGQHRRADKGLPYEEAIRVPLLVRGPGVPSRVEPSVASKIDLAPTLADLAGAETPDFVDGRSLVPLLRGETPSAWRAATLVERDRSNEVAIERGDIGGEPTTPAFRVLRTANRVYVRYPRTEEEELYDLEEDPFQLQNLAGDPASKAEIARLRAWQDALGECSGQTCRDADAMAPATA